MEWLNGHHRFLWLKGKAGTGKSTIMKNMLEELRNTESLRSFSIVSYFYDASGVELERSILGLLRTVLYQVFSQNQELLEDLVSLSDARFFIKGKNLSWKPEELKDLLRHSARLRTWRPTILLLDALDEGPRDEIRPLLLFLEQIFSASQEPLHTLRVCFSSRHYPNVTLRDCLEVWAERYNQQEIETIATEKLSTLSENPQNRKLFNYILVHANGIFLWVDFVTSALLMADDDGAPISQKLLRIRDIPPALDDLYAQIFLRLSEIERDETFQIFKWVLYAPRRTSPSELSFAMQFESAGNLMTFASWRSSDDFIDEGPQMEQFVRNRSRGLLENQTAQNISGRSSILNFIHQTVPEFLRGRGPPFAQTNH